MFDHACNPVTSSPENPQRSLPQVTSSPVTLTKLRHLPWLTKLRHFLENPQRSFPQLSLRHCKVTRRLALASMLLFKYIQHTLRLLLPDPKRPQQEQQDKIRSHKQCSTATSKLECALQDERKEPKASSAALNHESSTASSTGRRVAFLECNTSITFCALVPCEVHLRAFQTPKPSSYSVCTRSIKLCSPPTWQVDANSLRTTKTPANWPSVMRNASGRTQACCCKEAVTTVS